MTKPNKLINNDRLTQSSDIFVLYFRQVLVVCYTHCKVASSNTSCLEAHAGFFRLLMKGIFDPYVL